MSLLLVDALHAPRRFVPTDHALVRVNNLPFHDLVPEAHRATAARLVRMSELVRWLDAARDRLCDELYRAVKQQTDPRAVRDLLELKRDVFAARASKIPQARVAPLCASPELADWYAARRELTELREVVLADHAPQHHAERLVLQHVLAADPLAKATAVSSLTLFDALQSYARPLAEHRKRERKSEHALVQYATRAMTRTSPYSHYTSVAFAHLTPGGDGLPIEITGEPIARVTPNHVLVRRLLDAAAAHAELRPHVRFRVCDGVRVQAGSLTYEHHVDDPAQQPRVHGTSSRRVSLPLSRTLVHLVTWISEQARPPRWTEIVDALAHLQPTAAREAAARYVDHLIGKGLLVHGFAIPEQTPDILAAAITQLRDLDHERGRGCADALERAAAALVAFAAAATASARPAPARALRQSLDEALALVGLPMPAETPTFYEDTAYRAPLGLAPGPWRGVQDELARLLAVLTVFDGTHLLKLVVRDEFVARFGVGGRCADAREFLQHAPEIFARSMTMVLKGVPAELLERHPTLRAIAEVRRALVQHLVAAGPDAEEIRLPDHLLAELTRRVPPELTRSASYAVFLQPELEDGRPGRVFVNRIYGGLGQFFSRFLPLFDESALAAVRDNVAAFAPDDVLPVAMRPTFGFNANLQPRLGERELAIGAQDDAGAHLPLGALSLEHDAVSDQLVVRERASGQRVLPLYTGFLIPYLMPQHLALLASLDGTGQIPLQLQASLDRERPEADRQRVRACPRLRAGQVVLARRRFIAPAREVPRPTPAEPDAAFHVRLNLWRLSHGMPDEVFVTGEPPARAAEQTHEDWFASLARTRPKPQYIDFRSTLLTGHLQGWLRHHAGGVVFEEAAPRPRDAAARRHGRPCAVEFVLELNRRAPGGPR